MGDAYVPKPHSAVHPTGFFISRADFLLRNAAWRSLALLLLVTALES
jgi:hypothetical protein